tara:strand:- start:28851 stop:29615 length:765 start_codon:yes stop_codon:yes gene_type:complete
MKILLVDLETSPRLAYVFGFWNQNIGLKQTLTSTYIMSYACKWLGDEGVAYAETRDENDEVLCEQLATYFDSADIVIAHNASKFDIPLLRARCLFHGIKPWSPIKEIDTLKVVKREFRFDRNSLAYLADYLGVEEKEEHKEFPGFELWSECIKGNPAAWREMRKYNIQDVETLEQVYLKLRPWMRAHPNVGVFEEKARPQCPKCGSEHIQFRGYTTTNVGKYRKLQCQDCGGWARTRFTEYDKDKRKQLVINAV